MAFFGWNTGGSLNYTDTGTTKHLSAGSLNNLIDEVIFPIGTVIARTTYYAKTPSLPQGWVECNGQTISDSDSMYNNKTVPNLNGSIITGNSRFIRSAYTSGQFGGTGSHYHKGVTGPANDAVNSTSSGGTFAEMLHIHYFTTGSTSTFPPYYTVKWIIRIK